MIEPSELTDKELLEQTEKSIDCVDVSEYISALVEELLDRYKQALKTVAQPAPALPDADGRAVFCMYCGESWQYPVGTPPKDIIDKARAHDAICHKSPLVAEINKLKAAIKEQ